MYSETAVLRQGPQVSESNLRYYAGHLNPEVVDELHNSITNFENRSSLTNTAKKRVNQTISINFSKTRAINFVKSCCSIYG